MESGAIGELRNSFCRKEAAGGEFADVYETVRRTVQEIE
jgi:hypothetical protein